MRHQVLVSVICLLAAGCGAKDCGSTAQTPVDATAALAGGDPIPDGAMKILAAAARHVDRLCGRHAGAGAGRVHRRAGRAPEPVEPRLPNGLRRWRDRGAGPTSAS